MTTPMLIDCRVYSGSLTQTEVDAMYKRGLKKNWVPVKHGRLPRLLRFVVLLAIALTLLALCGHAHAQVLDGSGPPSPSVCVTGAVGTIYIDHASGQKYTCTSGLTWSAPTGGYPGLSGPNVSPQVVFLSKLCAGLQADLNTGQTRTGATATDFAPCLNAAIAVAGGANPIKVMVDGVFEVSGIQIPKGGNVTFQGLGGWLARVKVTGYAISGNVATFTTLPQTLAVGDTVTLGLFSSSTFLNGSQARVIATGLSATQFEAAFTHANASATESGEGDLLYGTGFYAAAGTNNDIIHNGVYGPNCYVDPGTATPGPAPGRSAANIGFFDFVINGNGGTGGATNNSSASGIRQGNSSTYSGPYTSTSCTYNDINIRDATGVRLERMLLFNAPAHELDLSNVEDATVVDTLAYSGYPNQPLLSTDGFHIDGPGRKIALRNVGGQAGELIAVNAPEGWSGVVNGLIIDGVTDEGSNSILRLYASSVTPPTGTAVAGIDTADIGHIHSVVPTNYAPILFGVETSHAANSIPRALAHIRIHDSYLMSGFGNSLMDNFGSIEFDNVTWRQTFCPSVANGFVSNTNSANTGDSLSFENVRIERTAAAGNCAAGLLNSSSGGYPNGATTALTVGTVTVNGFGLTDQATGIGAMSALVTLGSGSTVGKLNAFSYDTTNVSARSNGSGTVTATQP